MGPVPMRTLPAVSVEWLRRCSREYDKTDQIEAQDGS